MTPYQQKFLDHLVMMAHKDKAYSWSAAKAYALLDPFQLSEMPAMLTAEMKRLQGLNAYESSTVKTETLRGQVTSRLESGR